MSVVVYERETNDHYVYTKGSPEGIQKICTPESIPLDFNSIVNEYSEKG